MERDIMLLKLLKHKFSEKYNNDYSIEQMLKSDSFPEFIQETIVDGVRFPFLENLVGREITNYNTMDTPIVSVMYEMGFDASYVAEGSEPPSVNIRHLKYTFRPVKFGVSLPLTLEAVEDYGMDFIGSRFLSRIGRAVAKAEDNYIFATLLNNVADGSTNFKTGDYVANHVLDGSKATWSIPNDLDHEKISVAFSILEKEGYTSRDFAVVMSSMQRQKLNMLTPFYGGSGWANLTPRATSAIEDATFKADLGLTGVDLYVTNAIPDDTVLIISKPDFAMFWERRPLGLTSDIRYANETRKLTFSERVACGVVDPTAGVLIKNLSTIDPATFV